MALRRALELLQAGERINDLLYRSALEGRTRRPSLQPLPALASCPGCARSHDARNTDVRRRLPDRWPWPEPWRGEVVEAS